MSLSFFFLIIISSVPFAFSGYSFGETGATVGGGGGGGVSCEKPDECSIRPSAAMADAFKKYCFIVTNFFE
jgi:hypothetical protein